MRELPVTTADGTTLYVEEHGDPQAPVTVVLAHGWVLDRRTWRGQTARLPRVAGVPVRILVYDHRGHGRSDPAAPPPSANSVTTWPRSCPPGYRWGRWCWPDTRWAA